MSTAYGIDVFCGASGIPSRWPLISGKGVVAYNLFRRCTTGESFPAYKGNSFDVRESINDKIGRNALPQIEKDIIRVAVFEPRISTVYPKVTLDQAAERVKIYIRGVLVEGEKFELVLNINMVTAQVVGVQLI